METAMVISLTRMVHSHLVLMRSVWRTCQATPTRTVESLGTTRMRPMMLQLRSNTGMITTGTILTGRKQAAKMATRVGMIMSPQNK